MEVGLVEVFVLCGKGMGERCIDGGVEAGGYGMDMSNAFFD